MNDKTAQNAAERVAELEAELARVKAENRHIRETHYHESAFKAFASRKAQDNATAFDAITKDKPTLAGFLRSLPCIEAPWDAAFQKRYCSSCTSENCDACANEQFRNNPEWWLSLPAAEVEQ